jgi:anti-anti-sigma factor
MSRHLCAEKRADVFVVHFLDKNIYADLVTAGLGDELHAIVRCPDCSRLVLNFSNVVLLSSAMLGKLVSAEKMMAEKGGTLRLCEIGPELRMIFTFTRLDHVFDIRETESDALAF